MNGTRETIGRGHGSGAQDGQQLLAPPFLSRRFA